MGNACCLKGEEINKIVEEELQRQKRIVD